MIMRLSSLLAGICLGCGLAFNGRAESQNPNTDWFKDAKYGVFMHFLPGDAKSYAMVDQFDVATLAGQLEAMGAKYFVLTLGQNSGYFNSPNAAYDRVTGYAPGARCAKRDLPLDLYRVLQPKGIRLMLYLPCQTPNTDARAQKAFGLAQGAKDQPLDFEFAKKWATVIQEWADRYGDKVAGWWFDGGYQHIKFNEEIAAQYAAAVKHGNPKAIVTFNPGVKLIRYTKAEDYTAGELNDPLKVIPAGRWLEGSQWHALTYLGSTWGQRNTRFTGEQWAAWVQAVTSKEGVVTLDMGPNYDRDAGPVGALAEAQVEQVKAIRVAVAQSKRLKRADSFLGVHFDFHAGPDCKEIGRNTTRAMIENVINLVQPDYLQIDCKGHPGLSSYPTKAGNQAPGFVGDPLRLWRDVTAGRGVALYMHYSGVWDSEAIRKHPDWAVINADGTTNNNATSFFSPYADQLLIPQLRELAGVYGVDGAWVDGECWASMPDYGDKALNAFRAATGIQTIPRKPGEPGWYEFLQFNREAYRDYLRRYIAEVKKTNPEMQLCSNWAFTDHMPEAVMRAGGLDLGRLFAAGQREFRPVFGALPGAAGQAVGPDGVELYHQARQGRRHAEVGPPNCSVRRRWSCRSGAVSRPTLPSSGTAPSARNSCRSWPRWQNSAVRARRSAITPSRCRRWRCSIPPPPIIARSTVFSSRDLSRMQRHAAGPVGRPTIGRGSRRT